jgi:toxin HigB-1
MIQSFKCKYTEKLNNDEYVRAFESVHEIARKKLTLLDVAVQLKDLMIPPGNRLEALKGDRKGQYSIRINDKWRICFIWKEDGPHNVEIVDYH